MAGILGADAPTVFLVDDDEDVRKLLHVLLESMGFQVKSFVSAQQFLDQYQHSQPGCLVSDIVMPGINGLELQDILIERDIHVPVIFITAHGSIAMAKSALKKGALDFIEKPVDAVELVNSVKTAIERDADLRKKYHEIGIVKARLASLTAREQEVLDCLVEGDSNQHVASRLGVSLRTVESHRKSILRKMHADSFMDLIRLLLAAPRI